MNYEGIIVVNKPQEMTSHDVVAIMRKKLKTKKVGHTGTLDPMAEGVLPICVGRATKIVDYLVDTPKIYRCEMTIGQMTDTQDVWGKVIDSDDKVVSEDEIRLAVSKFIGDIEQVPPMYSALKVDGKKLVDLAREGIVVERKKRPITIYGIEILKVDFPKVEMVIQCSKGTYIRTLCHDIGLELGTFAHMSQLLRLETGGFTIDQAFKLEALTPDSIEEQIIPIDKTLNHFDKIIVPLKYEKKINNGVKIDLTSFIQKDTNSYLYYKVYLGEKFIGIAEKIDGKVIMKKLMVI